MIKYNVYSARNVSNNSHRKGASQGTMGCMHRCNAASHCVLDLRCGRTKPGGWETDINYMWPSCGIDCAQAWSQHLSTTGQAGQLVHSGAKGQGENLYWMSYFNGESTHCIDAVSAW